MINIKDNEQLKEILLNLDKAEKIMKNITINTNQTGIIWLSHLRISIGYLRDSINELNKQIIKNECNN